VNSWLQGAYLGSASNSSHLGFSGTVNPGLWFHELTWWYLYGMANLSNPWHIKAWWSKQKTIPYGLLCRNWSSLKVSLLEICLKTWCQMPLFIFRCQLQIGKLFINYLLNVLCVLRHYRSRCLFFPVFIAKYWWMHAANKLITKCLTHNFLICFIHLPLQTIYIYLISIQGISELWPWIA
jgi:hypothetical protein